MRGSRHDAAVCRQDPAFSYRSYRLLDGLSQDLSCCLHDALSWMESQHRASKHVLVHCHAGVSRSVTLVAAFLMWQMGLSALDALSFVKDKRPVANPNTAFQCQLLEWEARRKNAPTPSRMYCMAPWTGSDRPGPYPQLVIKPSDRSCIPATRAALHPRRCLVIQGASRIFVWFGTKCNAVMELRTAASQFVAALQSMEPAAQPCSVVTHAEGQESAAFWELLDAATELDEEAAGSQLPFSIVEAAHPATEAPDII